MKLISFVFLLAIVGACSAAATNSNEYCVDMKQLESLCGSYTNRTLTPLLDHIEYLKNTLQVKDNKFLNEIGELQEKNIQNEAIINEYRSQVNDLPKKCLFVKNDTYINEIASKSQTIADQNKKITNLTTQVQADAVKLRNFDKQVKEFEDKLKKCEVIPSSCIPYGNNAGIHKIEVCTLPPFEVLCDNETAGSGWTVIQQRIKGKEYFNRDWESYREGFGSFDGDFFLGLEKIHKLTTSQPYKLYIYLEHFNGTIFNAQYDNFTIAAEADNYRLSSLGKFSGSDIHDAMTYHENQQFTTFDRDHDSWKSGNCAIERHGGWWYRNDDYYDCAPCNLNGKYFGSAVDDMQSVYWDLWYSLKTVKMLIRPKSN